MSLALPRGCLLLLALWAGTAQGLCDLPPPVASGAGEITLPEPPPGEALIGWLQREQAEWTVELDGVPVPLWPERGGRLPLYVGHTGQAPRLAWIAPAGTHSRPPRLSLRCVAVGQSEAREFAARTKLARELGELYQGADRMDGVRHALRLWLAQGWFSDEPEGQAWLAAQRILLARFAEDRVARAEFARQLQDRARAAGDRLLGAHASLEIGMALYLQDRPQARQSLAEARLAFAELGEDFFSALAQQELCLQRRLDGDLQGAIDCYAEVIEEHRALGETESMLRSQLNRSTALTRSGRYEEAYAQLAEAAELSASVQDRELAASVSRQQAQYLRWRGDFEGALRLLGELREHYLATQDNLRLAQTESIIGTTFGLAGEPARAVEYFRSGEARLAGIDNAWERVGLGRSLALSLSDLGRIDEALQAIQDAIAGLGATDDAILAGSVWLAMAEIRVQRGEFEAATRALQELPASLSGTHRIARALIEADLGKDPPGVDWSTELESALAADQLLLALSIGERWLRQLEGAGHSSQALAQAKRLVERATPVIETIRSPQLRDALLGQLHRLVAVLMSSQVAGPVEAGRSAAVHGLLVALARSSMAARRDAPNQDLLLALEKQIGSELMQAAPATTRSSRSLLLDLVGAASDNAPATVSAIEPAPSLALEPDTRVVLPLFGRASAGLLVLDGKQWSWWPIDQLALARLRQSLPALLASGHAEREAVDVQIDALRQALGLERWLPEQVRTLWLGAHRELSALPLELALQRDAPLAVGWVLSPEPSAVPRPRRLHLLGVAAAGESGLPALAAVQDELRDVAEPWSALGNAQIASPASREALVDALSEPGAVVHLASHGRGSATRYEESGLWMAGTDQGVDFVSAYRLRGLPVRAGLVVLSACESGLGAGQVGTSLGSVASALSEAGADSVIGARWAIGDRAARVFATALHTARGAQGLPSEVAVARARSELRAQPALRNPTHWAGWFVLSRGIPAKSEVR